MLDTIKLALFRSAKAAVEPLRKSVAIRAAVRGSCSAATPIYYLKTASAAA